MEEFLREVKTLERIIYKSKNAHRSSLYFRKMVHVKRLAKKLVDTGVQRRQTAHIANSLQNECVASYIALSSCMGIGHYLGFAIGTMATVAKIFSLCHTTSFTATHAEKDSGKRADSESEDISDIFSKF